MCKSKDCQHGKESPIKDWKHRVQFGPDGKRLGNGTVIVGWNDMATTHKALAAECMDDATKYRAGTHKRLNWKCSVCGYEWPATGSDRVRGKGCPCCSNKVVVPGINDMATTHPGLAKECINDSTKYVAGTGVRLSWKCLKCGFKWSTRGADRVDGYGCKPCGYKIVASKVAKTRRVAPSRKSLAVLRPGLLGLYRGKQDPRTIYPNSKTVCDWACQSCGKIYPATFAAKTKSPLCKGCGRKRGGESRKISPFEKSLSFLMPELAKEYCGKQDPRTVFLNAAMCCNWSCRLCGETFKARVCDRSAGRNQTCRDCSESGFNPSKHSVFYLITRAGCIKLGIANNGSGRLDRHRRAGWSHLATISLPGKKALELEKSLKFALKAKMIPHGRQAFLVKFDGYTEAWPEEYLKVRTIRGLCRKLGINLEAFLAA